jgi:hypothetical protein
VTAISQRPFRSSIPHPGQPHGWPYAWAFAGALFLFFALVYGLCLCLYFIQGTTPALLTHLQQGPRAARRGPARSHQPSTIRGAPPPAALTRPAGYWLAASWLVSSSFSLFFFSF